MKAHPKTAASCNRSALDFLPEVARKAELISLQVATYGKLQKFNLHPSVAVTPLRALVGRRCRLDQASRPDTARYGRHFLLRLRGMKQLKSLAPGPYPVVKTGSLLVCSRFLTVCKNPASRAHRLLGCAARVIARLLPDCPDFLTPLDCFQGSKYECHA